MAEISLYAYQHGWPVAWSNDGRDYYTPEGQPFGWRSGDWLYAYEGRPLGWFDRGDWSKRNLTFWSTAGKPLYYTG